MSRRLPFEDRYLCGWRVRTAIDLPELAPWNDRDRAVDVEIRRDMLPSPRAQHRRGRLTLEISGRDDVLLDFDGVARLRIADGRRVTLDVRQGTDLAIVRLVLLGSGLAVLAFQRGMLPLHAAALQLDDAAVAVCGRSGTGKSTLAASMALQGVPVLADDVCVVQRTNDQPLVWPSVARIKLWRDAVARLGVEHEATARIRPGIDKYSLPNSCRFPERPIPLAALGVLSPGAPRRLGGIDAATAVRGAVYRRWLGEMLGARAFIAQASMTILGTVPVFTIPERTSLSAEQLHSLIETPLHQYAGRM